MSLFEKASRKKLRFPSTKGELSVEQLWDLPLTSNNGFDLDTIAKAVNKTVKETAEESFVKPVVSANVLPALRLEVVKRIIEVKLEEADKATKAAAKRQERQQLLEALAHSKQNELAGLSPEEIQKRLDALDE